MKKICMLAVMHSAKDDRIFFKESLSLKKAGYEVVHLLATDHLGHIKDMSGEILNKNGEADIDIDGIRTYGIPENNGLIQRTLKKFFMGSFYERYILKGIEINADVYHAHEPQSYFLALRIAKRTGAKVVYDAHESWLTGTPKDMLIKRKYLKNLTYLIAANPLTIERLTKDLPNVKSETIYNASILKATEYKHCEEIIMTHEGSFPFNRGLKLMLDALKILKERSSEFKLKIIGEFGALEQEYFDEFVSRNDLTKNIHVTGWKRYEEVGDELKGASIGLILNTPTPNNLYGGPPNKLFNYMAMNMSVVAVDLPETKRIIEENNIGIVLKTREASELADTLYSLIKNRDLLDQKRRAAHAAHLQMNWDEEAKKLIGFYKNEIFANSDQ